MTEGYHFEDEIQQRAYDAHLMRRLLQYLRPHRRLMQLAAVLLLVAAVLSSIVPWLNWQAISWYINNPERTQIEQQLKTAAPEAAVALRQALEVQKHIDQRHLLVLIAIAFGLMLVEGILRYIEMVVVAYVGQKTMMTMRMEIFTHLQKMSLRFLDKNPVGRLMTRVTNDVEKIQETIVNGAVQTINDLAVLAVVLCFMFWNNWRLALITLSPLPFVFVTAYVFRKYAQASYLEVRRKIATLNAYMQETLSGIRIVQLFSREKATRQQYNVYNAEHRDEWFRQVHYYAVYFPVVDFLGAVSLALIIYYGGLQILRAEGLQSAANIGMFFAYVQWSERLYGPIRALADRFNLILEAMASSHRVFELLDTPEDIANKPGALPAPRLRGDVQFQGTWFAYEQPQWVLRDIDLAIRPGERIAVVGHTGAGKSSLINVLTRFYDIQRGAVLVDGVDVRDYQKESLRRQIGVVLQDVFLFNGTIENNIRLGNEELDFERVRACAEYVNAAPFIERLPGGYQYVVGERGGNISTGQRQLLAFARVLAHDPAILVLDEATSSIDPETEALIQDAIGKLMEARTSIVIAHRLSTVQHADRIVVMHHGEIREVGTHQELLAQRGLYHTLYQLQYR